MKINSVSNLSVLCARMNNLNVSNEHKNIVNNSELISSQASLAFRAQVLYGYRRPVINNADTKIVYDKVSQVLKKLPDSARMTKPILVKTGDESYGFTWDKSNPNKYKLLIKNNINSVEDWEKADSQRSVMSCMFNDKGMLQIGELTRPLKADYSQGVFYHHGGKDGRKIRIDDLTLRPSTESYEVWSIIPDLSTKYANGEVNLKEKLKDVMLNDMFIELTRSKTSIMI